ncbi:MAG: hypothetical protein M0Z31_05330 [Clostridia bacterium]|nr:hypothetical protein [Clostridia bacterium]
MTLTIGNSIPNGTSITIMRGTAVCLVKKLMKSAKTNDGSEVTYDYLKVGQLSGCLGINEETAIDILGKVNTGETPEQVIDNFLVERSKLKEETQRIMKEKLDQLKL